jgi:hypothetical protein
MLAGPAAAAAAALALPTLTSCVRAASNCSMRFMHSWLQLFSMLSCCSFSKAIS